MRVLIAPDDFGAATGDPPGLTAPQAAAAVARGWTAQVPIDDLEICALSDGGPGMLDVLIGQTAAERGRRHEVRTVDAYGKPVLVSVLHHGSTAFVEAAQMCGLAQVTPTDRDPRRATTAGLGPAVTKARDLGATTVLLGLAGLGTHDAGAGLLAALALEEGLIAPGEHESVQARFCRGGERLEGVQVDELAWLAPLRESWNDIRLVALADSTTPLLGLHGASAVDAESRGADRATAQYLERCLGDFAAAAGRVLGLPARGRLAPSMSEGSGAGGGLAFGALLLGGDLRPAAAALFEEQGLAERIASADLVVTGSHTFGWRSLRDSVITGVADAAREHGVPVVVLAGAVHVGRREAQTIGVDGAYSVARGSEAASEPALEALAARVARTWSHS